MSNINLKRKIGNIWNIAAAKRPRKVILLYHSIGVNPPAVSKDHFHQQIAWLAENGSIVKLDDLLKNDSTDKLQVAISFDDGYSSLHDVAVPILNEFGAAATVFLNTSKIGDFQRNASDASLGYYSNEEFLSWKDIQNLVNASWTIGSHGVEHLDLTQQSINIVERELINSKREIELKLSMPCIHFAYTWGNFTKKLQNAVKKAGYESAVSGLHGVVLSSSDRYALPRIDIRAEYELRDFIDVVQGSWDYLGLKHRLLRCLS